MCGIAGYFTKNPINERALRKTLSLMKNRGPDSQDFALVQTQKYHIGLLHSRLSIIDLDPRSNQPFSIGNHTIIFNGEIYNYLELKEHLEKKHVVLRTSSDTEILLHYYILYGEKALDYFEGMWAFSIWDRENGTLFISRDRFGEKPLFYYSNANGFYFGSEIKFLKSMVEETFDINYQHINRYLINGFRSLNKINESFFLNVYSLPSGHNLRLKQPDQMQIHSYWKPSLIERFSKLSETDAKENFRDIFYSSVKLRLRSDVPLAFCLSGGIDSASIVSTAAKVFNSSIATFSIIDSDRRYNEFENISATVKDLGCSNTAIEISRLGFFERLENLIAYHDAPVSTISYYVHSFLSEEIANHGYKVALSGSGADEMVTGYYDHFLLQLYELRDHPSYPENLANWENFIKPFVRNPNLQNPFIYAENPAFREHIYLNRDAFLECLIPKFEEDFYENAFFKSLMKNRMYNEMFHEIVPIILHEDDLNSMYYSIENRSPFLDSKLYEFCLSLPPHLLIKNGYAKFILREAMEGVLNDQVRLSREKKGFNASLNSLVDFNDTETQEFLLYDSPIYDILRKDSIAELFKLNPLPNSYSKFLFNFINAKIFLEKQ